MENDYGTPLSATVKRSGTASSRLALMLSHDPGLEIARWFANRNETIAAVYFESDDRYAETAIQLLDVDPGRIFFGKSIMSDRSHLLWLKEERIDFIIAVYWPWLLSEAFRACAGDTLNFHPALLPKNRGWYPHVFNILDQSPAGVSLHRMTEGADEGDIWAQRRVYVGDLECADSLYRRLQREIVDLFIETWDEICSGRIRPRKQDDAESSYHSKADLEVVDGVNLETMSARDLLNVLRARSFGDRGFAYVESGGVRTFLNLRVGPTSEFGHSRCEGSNEEIEGRSDV